MAGLPEAARWPHRQTTETSHLLSEKNGDRQFANDIRSWSGRLRPECTTNVALWFACTFGFAVFGLLFIYASCASVAPSSVDSGVMQISLFSCVASLFAGGCSAGTSRNSAAAPPSEVPYYGRSPPVYPSRRSISLANKSKTSSQTNNHIQPKGTEPPIPAGPRPTSRPGLSSSR